ncbi:MAG: hypothetical protein KJ067_22885 [Vicinamibacteria bacterium]|nr:hypothetical protein [Vicinamibacteria bacterium]
MSELPQTCQACQRPASPQALAYRKGDSIVSHDSFLQCDVCERLLCADCLQIYDILSGDDFLCAACAASLAAGTTTRPAARPPR